MKSPTPASASSEASPETGAEAPKVAATKEQQPQKGGSFIRNADGSLSRNPASTGSKEA
jgi:hypothetical protein